ncbi:MAG: histidinol-phosphate transaminase [Flaviflexus sp.]|nr:histidinol-phosphate transaminase [Flaviflexus sp.]
MRLPLRDELRGRSPYGAPQLDVPVRLNVNENPYPPSSQMVADIAEAVGATAAGLNRYPDRDAMALRADLADYLKLESQVELRPDQVWAANGSNEVMIQLLQAFAGHGRTVLGADPGYSMYGEYCLITGSTWTQVPRREDFTLDVAALADAVATQRPSVLLLASPNNPTGTALQETDLRVVLEMTRESGPDGADTVVVIDEAYGEFRRDGVASALHLLADHPHLVVSRTMSKAFGAAGLRLGYLAAAPEIIDALMIVRLPYHLSALTQAAGRAALGHAVEQLAQINVLRAERDRLEEALTSLGWKVAPSDANFVFFGITDRAGEVWQQLLDDGVLIRHTGPAGWLRVSVGTPEENDRFIEAIGKVRT